MRIGSCTVLNSNQPHYQLKVGDEVVVQGIEQKNSTWNGKQVTCLS